ncbi:CLUMA_CG008997, isoform A [Clunio marinus]|uniref:CLUMA_CG008997, isoform A n=1 Tax=Clunio marinus TaxID=568069 RepID=A0A1J1I5H2_9DIPT|nr:CLUMA_CG008997, isoform A [Clunio marinus]
MSKPLQPIFFTSKYKKIVLNEIVIRMKIKKEIDDVFWNEVSKAVTENYFEATPLQIKEFFFKEIYPSLSDNNYGLVGPSTIKKIKKAFVNSLSPKRTNLSLYWQTFNDENDDNFEMKTEINQNGANFKENFNQIEDNHISFEFIALSDPNISTHCIKTESQDPFSTFNLKSTQLSDNIPHSPASFDSESIIEYDGVSSIVSSPDYSNDSHNDSVIKKFHENEEHVETECTFKELQVLLDLLGSETTNSRNIESSMDVVKNSTVRDATVRSLPFDATDDYPKPQKLPRLAAEIVQHSNVENLEPVEVNQEDKEEENLSQNESIEMKFTSIQFVIVPSSQQQDKLPNEENNCEKEKDITENDFRESKIASTKSVTANLSCQQQEPPKLTSETDQNFKSFDSAKVEEKDKHLEDLPIKSIDENKQFEADDGETGENSKSPLVTLEKPIVATTIGQQQPQNIETTEDEEDSDLENFEPADENELIEADDDETGENSTSPLVTLEQPVLANTNEQQQPQNIETAEDEEDSDLENFEPADKNELIEADDDETGENSTSPLVTLEQPVLANTNEQQQPQNIETAEDEEDSDLENFEPADEKELIEAVDDETGENSTSPLVTLEKPIFAITIGQQQPQNIETAEDEEDSDLENFEPADKNQLIEADDEETGENSTCPLVTLEKPIFATSNGQQQPQNIETAEDEEDSDLENFEPADENQLIEADGNETGENSTSPLVTLEKPIFATSNGQQQPQNIETDEDEEKSDLENFEPADENEIDEIDDEISEDDFKNLQY